MSKKKTDNLLAIQIRVLFALILRETRATFGTSSLGYLWAIITPTASILVLVFIFSLAGRQPPFGSSLALFFATGVLILQFYNELSSKLMTVFDANRALLTYPVIKEVDTLFARSILIMLTYCIIMVCFYGLLFIFGLSYAPANLEQIFIVFFVAFFLGLSVGILNAVTFSLWKTWGQIEKILSRPLFFISGIFYVPSQLPKEAIAVLQWNPVLHLVEWMREGYYPNYNSLILDKSYPVLLALLLLMVGLASERFTRKMRY
ncbi:MAG: ABC transporter permease [Pasteurella sp.]|nr:ABC transporter permease [Pasteurella sp.]